MFRTLQFVTRGCCLEFKQAIARGEARPGLIVRDPEYQMKKTRFYAGGIGAIEGF